MLNFHAHASVAINIQPHELQLPFALLSEGSVHFLRESGGGEFARIAIK